MAHTAKVIEIGWDCDLCDDPKCKNVATAQVYVDTNPDGSCDWENYHLLCAGHAHRLTTELGVIPNLL